MKKIPTVAALLMVAISASAGGVPPLRLVQTIALPDVAGRIDHLSANLKGRRIFLAALEKNTLESSTSMPVRRRERSPASQSRRACSSSPR